MSRTWKTGDPEPDDHPQVVGEDKYDGTCHYKWEEAEWDPAFGDWFGSGWWCLEGSGDLYDWSEILRQCDGLLTEVIN